jgi:hypothetical protein
VDMLNSSLRIASLLQLNCSQLAHPAEFSPA